MRLSECIDYHPETGELVYTKSKGCKAKGSKAGTISKGRINKYIVLRVSGKNVYAHRFIMDKVGFDISGMYVDHINGNTLDNRLSNLRVVSPQESNMNLSMQSRSPFNRSGIYRKKNRFVARITYKKKNIHIGSFIKFNDAVAARVKKERELGFHENHARVKVKSRLLTG